MISNILCLFKWIKYFHINYHYQLQIRWLIIMISRHLCNLHLCSSLIWIKEITQKILIFFTKLFSGEGLQPYSPSCTSLVHSLHWDACPVLMGQPSLGEACTWLARWYDIRSHIALVSVPHSKSHFSLLSRRKSKTGTWKILHSIFMLEEFLGPSSIQGNPLALVLEFRLLQNRKSSSTWH